MAEPSVLALRAAVMPTWRSVSERSTALAGISLWAPALTHLLAEIFGGEQHRSEAGRGGEAEQKASQPDSDDLATDLTRRYWTRLCLFAARRLRDRNAAEDVAQETMRRALEALRERRVRDLAALPGFLFQTATNVCLHRLRSSMREAKALARFGQEAADESSDRTTNPLTGLISEERRAQVRDAMARLADADRDLLRKIYVELVEPSQVAASLGINPVALRARKHRALQRLAALLEAGGGHDCSPAGT